MGGRLGIRCCKAEDVGVCDVFVILMVGGVMWMYVGDVVMCCFEKKSFILSVCISITCFAYAVMSRATDLARGTRVQPRVPY